MQNHRAGESLITVVQRGIMRPAQTRMLKGWAAKASAQTEAVALTV